MGVTEHETTLMKRLQLVAQGEARPSRRCVIEPHHEAFLEYHTQKRMGMGQPARVPPFLYWMDGLMEVLERGYLNHFDDDAEDPTIR